MIKHYIVYCIENKINGKKYIGQTTRKLLLRINSHYNSAKTKKRQCVFIQNAIKKYGKENFIITILDSSATSQLELNKLENFYIRSNNTLFPNGYNAHYTEENFKVKVINHITRARMSKNMKRINSSVERQLINFNAGKTNLGKKHKDNNIKYYGVYKRGNSFRATLFIDYVQIQIGSYTTEQEAATAIDIYIIKNHKELINLINFKDRLNDYLANKISEPTKIKKQNERYSKFHGVGFSTSLNKWRARISKWKKFDIHIGFFDTEIEAAIAYNNKVKELNVSMPLNEMS